MKVLLSSLEVRYNLDLLAVGCLLSFISDLGNFFCSSLIFFLCHLGGCYFFFQTFLSLHSICMPRCITKAETNQIFGGR